MILKDYITKILVFMNKTRFTIFLSFLIILNSCSSKVDPVTGEKILIETNPNIKAREFVDKEGSILGSLSGRDNNKILGTIDFANSNILWRATLKTIDFMPIANLDYVGGMIIYDWYSENENSNEQIKVQVRFLSPQLRSDSLQVTTYKKKCSLAEKCIIYKADDKLSVQIKDSILASARNIKIEEAKKEKK